MEKILEVLEKNKESEVLSIPIYSPKAWKLFHDEIDDEYYARNDEYNICDLVSGVDFDEGLTIDRKIRFIIMTDDDLKQCAAMFNTEFDDEDAHYAYAKKTTDAVANSKWKLYGTTPPFSVCGFLITLPESSELSGEIIKIDNKLCRTAVSIFDSMMSHKYDYFPLPVMISAKCANLLLYSIRVYGDEFLSRQRMSKKSRDVLVEACEKKKGLSGDRSYFWPICIVEKNGCDNATFSAGMYGGTSHEALNCEMVEGPLRALIDSIVNDAVLDQSRLVPVSNLSAMFNEHSESCDEATDTVLDGVSSVAVKILTCLCKKKCGFVIDMDNEEFSSVIVCEPDECSGEIYDEILDELKDALLSAIGCITVAVVDSNNAMFAFGIHHAFIDKLELTRMTFSDIEKRYDEVVSQHLVGPSLKMFVKPSAVLGDDTPEEIAE